MRKALVIDDSQAVRSLLGSFLETMQFQIAEAGNGREALQRLKTHGPFDLALVDIHMPEMNGIDFVQAVRADRTYNDLPLMMVTTESDKSQVSKAMQAGANEYVMKPFTKQMIQKKLTLLGL
ncbi:response regulator [Candidatus Entotheonella serta]|nr:response regulator [Candidatus Entotheonella serta]